MESILQLMIEDLTCAPSSSLIKFVHKLAPSHTCEIFPSLCGTFFTFLRLASCSYCQSHLVWLFTLKLFLLFIPWSLGWLSDPEGNGVRRQGFWEGISITLVSKICTVTAKALILPMHEETDIRCHSWNCLDLRLFTQVYDLLITISA